jgi:FtsH-binding integral membrane protein
MRKTKWLFYLCDFITFGICIALFCCHKVARNVPVNYICLFAFTCFQSYMLAAICIYETPETVLIAAALTLTMFVGLTLLTFFTNTELSILSALLAVLCHLCLIMIPLFIIWPNRYVYIIICLIVITAISIFIIWDTKQIASGKKYGLDYDDYIIGALLLYTDIVTMFIYILAILGLIKKD